MPDFAWDGEGGFQREERDPVPGVLQPPFPSPAAPPHGLQFGHRAGAAEAVWRRGSGRGKLRGGASPGPGEGSSGGGGAACAGTAVRGGLRCACACVCRESLPCTSGLREAAGRRFQSCGLHTARRGFSGACLCVTHSHTHSSPAAASASSPPH